MLMVMSRNLRLLGEVAIEYFNTLFTSSNPDNFQEMFHDLLPRISEEVTQILLGQCQRKR